MIETIPNLPADTVGFRASDVVSADDYRTVIEPALAAARETGTPVNVVYVIGDDVKHFDLGAMAQDRKVGEAPAKDWGRVAVVTDKHWIVGAVHLFLHFYHCDVKTFPVAQEADAISWATHSPSR